DYPTRGTLLKNTPGTAVLEEVGNRLDVINEHLLTNADRPEFRAWARSTFSPMLQQLGYSGRPDDTPVQKQNRAMLFMGLGNVGDDPQVIQQARAMVQKYLKDPASVDPTLASAVIPVAARHGDAELYNQFKAELPKAKSPQQYYRLFYGLAEFPQPELIRQ